MYCATNYYYFCTGNDTSPCSLVSSQKDPAQPSTSRSPALDPSSKRKCNSWNGTSSSALGWSFLDQQPSLPQFSEESVSNAAVDGSSTPFDFFPILFPEFMIKHIKTETKRYAKSIADKLRGTNKLKPHSVWQTWTGVWLPEMYLFFVVIIYMCLVKKPKLTDYWSTSNFISTQFFKISNVKKSVHCDTVEFACQ